MDRKELEASLKRAGEAVSRKEVVPALASYFFGEGWLATCDDELAISVPCPLELDGGVPAKLLKTWVTACSGDEVIVSSDLEGEASLKCGRSSLKLPKLPASHLVFRPPREPDVCLMEPFDLLDAIHMCAPFVGNDSAHPWRMGMTLALSRDCIDVLATNNVAMAHAMVATSIPLCDLTVVLPHRFVEVLLAFSATEHLLGIQLSQGWAMAVFVSGSFVFARTLSETNVAGYKSILTEVLRDLRRGSEMVIPEGLAGILERASKILLQTDEGSSELLIEDKLLRIEISGSGAVLKETLRLKHGVTRGSRIVIAPGSAVPALPYVDRMAVAPKALLLTGVGYEVVVSVRA